MLDRKKIALRIGISVDTFRRTVEKKPDFHPPTLRLSRELVRWDEADIERWFRQQRQLAKA